MTDLFPLMTAVFAHMSAEDARRLELLMVMLGVAAVTVVMALIWGAVALYRQRTRKKDDEPE